MNRNIKMNDLNYFPLDVESNIYSLTTLSLDDGTSKVLVATSNCQIYCINYSKFKPHAREVEFTYIPNGARIISIGSLRRGLNDFVIAITHSLSPSTQKSSARSNTSYSARDPSELGRPLTTYYLNIYASASTCTSFDLDSVAQGCQTIRLRYVPYHLYQTELSVFSKDEQQNKTKPCWLLSGSDNSIHVFTEDRLYHSFNETPVEESFPEFQNLPGLALWIDVMNLKGLNDQPHQRLAALGFEDGSVRLYHSVFNTKDNVYELISESCFDEFSTITPSVRLFRVKSTYQSSLRDYALDHRAIKNIDDKQTERINLLVVNSTNPAIVFTNVLKTQLSCKQVLPDSCRLDCSVTSAIGDTNLDGYNEILIGTHGRELLTYQFDPTADLYHLSHQSEINHPIYSIATLNLTNDVLDEVIVLLGSGILVLQSAVKDVIQICRRRINALLARPINDS